MADSMLTGQSIALQFLTAAQGNPVTGSSLQRFHWCDIMVSTVELHAADHVLFCDI
jgi:hypothetical protein